MMKIEKIFYSVLVFIVVLVSCNKDENGYQSTARITGSDKGMCSCCGGYFIEIDDSTYNFDSLPLTSDIDLTSTTFPVAVKLDWLYERKCGEIQYIEIVRIEEQ